MYLELNLENPIESQGHVSKVKVTCFCVSCLHDTALTNWPKFAKCIFARWPHLITVRRSDCCYTRTVLKDLEKDSTILFLRHSSIWSRERSAAI